MSVDYLIALSHLLHELFLSLPLLVEVLHVLLLESLEVLQHGLSLLVLLLGIQQSLLLSLFDLVLDHLGPSGDG